MIRPETSCQCDRMPEKQFKRGEELFCLMLQRTMQSTMAGKVVAAGR